MLLMRPNDSPHSVAAEFGMLLRALLPSILQHPAPPETQAVSSPVAPSADRSWPPMWHGLDSSSSVSTSERLSLREGPLIALRWRRRH